jgi:hypothetical protein
MMDWLRSDDEDMFGAGIAMLMDSRPLFSGPDDPKLGPELLRLINRLPLGKLKDAPNRVESWFRFEACWLRSPTWAPTAGRCSTALQLSN